MAAPLLFVQLRDYQEPAPVFFPYIYCPLEVCGTNDPLLVNEIVDMELSYHGRAAELNVRLASIRKRNEATQD